MLAFTRASNGFFVNPPQGFTDGRRLLEPRASLFFEAVGQDTFTKKLLASGSGLEELSEAQALKHFPILRQGYAKRTWLRHPVSSRTFAHRCSNGTR